jgi:hypothetical protein
VALQPGLLAAFTGSDESNGVGFTLGPECEFPGHYRVLLDYE